MTAAACGDTLKAPFPYFGGKSRIARLVWARFGDVPNYVEPFAGSLAVLLGRPTDPGTETVNDINCYLSNFWRALAADPGSVAYWAEWPVNEACLHARHWWLVNRAEFRERMKCDPAFYDAKIAGWWVWGACAWIGSGWCSRTKRPNLAGQRPALGNAGMGINRQLPHVGDAGMGIHRKLPHVGDAGRGIHRKLPHVGDAGRGIRLLPYFEALSRRLARVRVCCGGWDRVLGPSVTTRHGMTAVFLDPPYALEADRAAELYADDDPQASREAREWALANGGDPALRIALCSYAESPCPEGWERVYWKAQGGYGSQSNGRGRENARRETIDFSPHCLHPGVCQMTLAWDV